MTAEQEEEDFIKNNYVARTLLNEPELPPVTWSNWYKHINWLQTPLLIGIPLVGLYGTFTTPLTLYTAIWSVIYYFITGLGITAGNYFFISSLFLRKMSLV